MSKVGDNIYVITATRMTKENPELHAIAVATTNERDSAFLVAGILCNAYDVRTVAMLTKNSNDACSLIRKFTQVVSLDGEQNMQEIEWEEIHLPFVAASKVKYTDVMHNIVTINAAFAKEYGCLQEALENWGEFWQTKDFDVANANVGR